MQFGLDSGYATKTLWQGRLSCFYQQERPGGQISRGTTAQPLLRGKAGLENDVRPVPLGRVGRRGAPLHGYCGSLLHATAVRIRNPIRNPESYPESYLESYTESFTSKPLSKPFQNPHRNLHQNLNRTPYRNPHRNPHRNLHRNPHRNLHTTFQWSLQFKPSSKRGEQKAGWKQRGAKSGLEKRDGKAGCKSGVAKRDGQAV